MTLARKMFRGDTPSICCHLLDSGASPSARDCLSPPLSSQVTVSPESNAPSISDFVRSAMITPYHQ